MDRDGAVQQAMTLLKHAYGDDLRDRAVGELVLLDREAAEFGNAWTVPFDSRRFLEEGDLDAELIPNLIIVPKDGHPAHFAPSADPVEVYLAAVAAGTQHWSRF